MTQAERTRTIKCVLAESSRWLLHWRRDTKIKMPGCKGAPGLGYSIHHTSKMGQNGKLPGALWSQDDFEENFFFLFFFPFLNHLVLETPPALPLSSKQSCDHNAPVSFPFWPFLMCGVEKRLPGACVWQPRPVCVRILLKYVGCHGYVCRRGL